MSEQTTNNCYQHEERLTRIEDSISRIEKNLKLSSDDLHELKQAVIGDTKIGLRGLVKDMESIKSWKAQVDLRVAGIAGGVTVVMLVAKYLFNL